jgi:hypothetical protein
LIVRLEAARAEIERTILIRARAVGGPGGTGDPDYAAGLRRAVEAAVGYGLSALGGGLSDEPIPPPLLLQARHAARNGVSLDTVLRRYSAGYTLLGDFIVREAQQEGSVGGIEVNSLLRSVAGMFDKVVAEIGNEYAREAEAQQRHAERQGKRETVRRLLGGELVDVEQLNYDLDSWHIGLIATGPQVGEALRLLADGLDRRLLQVSPDEQTAWAWLGGRRKVEAEEVSAVLSSSGLDGARVAIGEPAPQLNGWRLTHQQAGAAIFASRNRAEPVVRYAEVALLASMLQDEVLTASLESLFLAPLNEERDGGVALRGTLRAYFAAQRNVSSAAAALGVTRKTISSRLRAIEERLGRPLDNCAAEMEAALKLDSCVRED